MEKDLKIYNAVASVAAKVFKTFDNCLFEPGKYDVPAVLNILKKHGKLFKDAAAEDAAAELVKIEIENFTCSFVAFDAFDLLKRLGAAYNVPTAARATFIKKADAAPVAVSFRVFAGLKDLCSRVSKNDIHEALNYICVDTRRRALIVCNGGTLSAVPVPEMFISEAAKDYYLITPAVLKAGRGVCNIDANGTAKNGAVVSVAVPDNIKYPDIRRILYPVPDQFITLGKKTFSEIKKNVAAAAKFGKVGTYQTPVILKADAGTNKMEIIGYREKDNDATATNETRRAVVSLPQPAPFAFAVAVCPDRINYILSAEKMYLRDNNNAICFVDQTRRVFSVMIPGADLYNTPWKNEFFSVSIYDGAPAVDAVAGTFEHAQDAAPAPFEDAQETAAAPVVSEEIKITYINSNYVPVITEEIRAAVAVAAEYKYIPYKTNYLGVRVSKDHTPVISGAELLLQRENLIFKDNKLICRNGKIFAYISVNNETLNINYDVIETADNVETPAPAVAEDAQETADNVETPAVSLPVATVPAVWYAVYQSGKLEKVYFSKMLAYDLQINSLFVNRETKDILKISSPDAAPAEFPRNSCPLYNAVFAADSVANDAPAVAEDAQETADDVETAAPAANDIETIINNKFETYLAAVAEDAQETAAAVPDSVPVDSMENDAPAVAEDAQETADNVETPAAIAFEFARRFRRIWQTAAAVLFLIVCAAVPVSVSDSVAVDSVNVANSPADAPAVSLPVDSVANVPAVAEDAQETAAAVPDSAPAVAKKRARRAVSFAAAAVDSCKQFAAVADSVAVDSMYFAADSVANAPAVADSVAVDSMYFAVDSVANAPAVADSVAVDSMYFAVDSVANVPAVADSVAVDSVPAANAAPAVAEDAQKTADDVETAAPAEDQTTPQDEKADDAPAVPDSAPAANSPAAAPVSVPVAAVSGCPAAPAVSLPVIGCNFIHCLPLTL